MEHSVLIIILAGILLAVSARMIRRALKPQCPGWNGDRRRTIERSEFMQIPFNRKKGQ